MKISRAIGKRKVEHDAQLKVKTTTLDALKKESDHITERNKISSDQYAKKNQEDIAALEEKIKLIDAKLSVYQDAFVGFLQENYPDWYETIGKVCNEEILFNKELNPQRLKKSVEALYGIQLDLTNVKVYSKTFEQYENERTEHRELIANHHKEFLEFREKLVHEEQGKLASISKEDCAAEERWDADSV